MSRLHPTIQFLLENLEGLFDDLDLLAIMYSMGDEQIVRDTFFCLMSREIHVQKVILSSSLSQWSKSSGILFTILYKGIVIKRR